VALDQSADRSSRLTWRLLPMKLSSTMNTIPANQSARAHPTGQHLLITLRARHAAIDLDDVAELALEGQPREYWTAIAL
jgi:hypothetical protein